MPDHLIVSEAARELSGPLGREVRPRDISTLFYERRLSDELCPIIGGRRMIPRVYLPHILAVLKEREGIDRNQQASTAPELSES